MRHRHKRKSRRRLRLPYRRVKPNLAAGTCPVCGCKAQHYVDSDTQETDCIDDWTCPACGRSGKESHTLAFNDHIVEG